ncbi:MAG: CHAP domain-containing protein [Patescibacteria group bacterium]|jgi:surface antigen
MKNATAWFKKIYIKLQIIADTKRRRIRSTVSSFRYQIKYHYGIASVRVPKFQINRSKINLDSLRVFNRKANISLMAAALIGSNFIHSSATSETNLYQFLPTSPDVTAAIITDVGQFTPTLNVDPTEVAHSLAGIQEQDYIAQASILAMSADNQSQYGGFAINYTVQQGDTWSGIAGKNNLHTASLFAANGIDEAKLKKNGLPKLSPGDVITVPAEDIDGGPTNWVAILNDINNAKKQVASGNSSSSTKKKTTSVTRVGTRDYKSYRGYPGGYCTSYVASRRAVGRWGNAGQWLSGARADGYATGRTPKAGAIMVTGESGWGHVAIVESVNGSTVTVSEENYKGFGIISSRTVSINSIPLKGFIY